MSEKAEAIILTLLGFTVGATTVALGIIKVEPALWRWIIKRAESKNAE